MDKDRIYLNKVISEVNDFINAMDEYGEYLKTAGDKSSDSFRSFNLTWLQKKTECGIFIEALSKFNHLPNGGSVDKISDDVVQHAITDSFLAIENILIMIDDIKHLLQDNPDERAYATVLIKWNEAYGSICSFAKDFRRLKLDDAIEVEYDSEDLASGVIKFRDRLRLFNIKLLAMLRFECDNPSFQNLLLACRKVMSLDDLINAITYDEPVLDLNDSEE